MENTSWTRQQIISVLIKSPHGKLEEYVQPMTTAMQSDEEFCAHLIAWQEKKGTINDAKIALPTLHYIFTDHHEFRSNALAHLALRSPRELEKAWHFARSLKKGKMNGLKDFIVRYLRHREQDRRVWTRTAVNFRRSLKRLYIYTHTKPAEYVKNILFENIYPMNSVFEAIASLKEMSAADVGQTITHYDIPFLMLPGALGARMKEPELLLSIIQSMTPAQLVNNTNMLKKIGVLNLPETRAAYEAKLTEGVQRKKGPLLKTTRAAEAVQDETLKAKLHGMQERQMTAQAGIEGDWLILGDRSPSMGPAIEYTRQLCAFMARSVKGKVHCVFFDESPRYFDFTGKTYQDILSVTKNITTGNATSIGCGVAYALENHIEVDGVAVVTDGGENRYPVFAQAYQKYCEYIGKDIPIYYYYIQRNEQDAMSHNLNHLGIEFQKFDIEEADYYSIPTLAQTMRTNKYSLAQEIYDTPLLMESDILKQRGVLV